MASPPALPRREGAGARQGDSVRVEAPAPQHQKEEASKIVVSQMNKIRKYIKKIFAAIGDFPLRLPAPSLRGRAGGEAVVPLSPPSRFLLNPP